MGKPTTTSEDQARAKVEGTITGAGRTSSIMAVGWVNLAFWGSLTATGLSVTLEKSFDGGTTWIPVARDATGALAQWTTFNAAGFAPQFFEPEEGVLYSLNTAGSVFSGTLNFRISS